MLPLLSQCVGEDLQISDVKNRYNPSAGGGDPSNILGWHRDKVNSQGP